MPLDVLPSQIVTFTRDESRANYLRDYSIRNPSGSTLPNQQPYVDASVLADAMAPIYANAVTLGNGLAVQTMTTAQLDNEAARLGTIRGPAVGASGYAVVQGSTGGGLIFAGDEIKSQAGLRYQCTATGLYLPGAFVPVQGVDTGPSTNLAPGSVMKWSVPRPGISQVATVGTQSNGAGLSNGRDVESNAELVVRLIALRANPPASGNDAAYQAAIIAAPGLSIQQPFTFPAILGPGTTGFTFTLRPATPGANRIPSAAQLEQVRAWVVGQFPKDDSLLACTIVAQPTTLYFRATWTPQSPGWVDSTTWPVYVSASPVKVLGAATPTVSSARVGTTGTTTSAPQVGQTIAFYDQPYATFRRKRILTVTTVSAGVSWDLVFDTTNSASDTSYTPVVGQPCCPWSDSLQSIVAAAVAFFDAVGPGEQVATFWDPGFRQRRNPLDPAAWASSLTNRILQPMFSLSSVADVVLLSPSVPYTPPTGSPGVSSNMLTLGSLAAFP